MNPVTAIERTLLYTKDPKGYLVEALGEAVFEERKPTLCIPDEIDKDFYGTGKHKSNFEQHIAKLLGKERALFFITGVQAQLAALISYCDRVPNYRVGWHVSSHLESAERDAYQHLYKLKRILLGESPDEHPTVNEIKEVLSRTESCRPAAILIEVPNRTLGCKTYSFEELQAISQACRQANVKLHCDGARLWEIEPYYQSKAGKSIADICALFDSVYVSFYKGLGGAAGAMLLSNDSDLIEEAKVWQRRTGGNVFTLMYQIIDCERGFNEFYGGFKARWKKMTDIADGVHKATAKYRTKDGLPYVQFNPEEPTCCQAHTVFQGFTADELLAARDRVEQRSNVRPFEKLRKRQTVDLRPKEERERDAAGEEIPLPDTTQFMEWLMIETTLQVETQVFVDAYVALCEELAATATGVA
ncbi:hypothetical protein M409DRAFT_69517 [Zasmidium cellare ATCC 36951]|uniref:Aromatic amino acid beta-eliminating lyase/threonine aldolase domain-containing protein n=1 Tax=Zasmidium cellare ATCC 36951 TaxID=1080233 RepID=A0A6A6C3V3_ZASCE|nr:uncharacterized protein M409DRAFT_69517 [Zasmidium cellare ATCC 36951]KAF2161701.1 hypothetical protein M409DRAFT_69517 [Zasmidium cellare ATCC 36951]